MNYINPYQFYSEIVNGEKPVKDIFGNLSFMSPSDYDELFDEFSLRLDKNFHSYKENELSQIHRRKYTIKPKIYTRIRLAVILLSVCALGATFDDNVYSYTLDFVLKKELCLMPMSLN